ncbi:hypothetical protein C0993_011722 [Termitomyces sp. T159_Od127]|nr:hypothetical protein C0993_011722 [Termitomyces sp. T159_Od127]
MVDNTTFIRLELVIWFVPSLIGNAVAVSFVGILLGPMYPLAMNHAGRVLPRWILTGSIGWIAGFGQTGSALVPFMTGAISNKYGIKSLQPLGTTGNNFPNIIIPGRFEIHLHHCSRRRLFLIHMLEDTIELEVRRETSRKHVLEEFGLPAAGTDVTITSGVGRPAKTKHQLATAHIQLVALCMSLFLAGWNDGTTGPLLPRIQSVYNDAQANGFVASFDTNAEAKMGILHALYGAGALCSPLVATQFSQQRRWSFHYLASLGLATQEARWWEEEFRQGSTLTTLSECLREIGQIIPEHPTTEQSSNEDGKFRQILSHKTVQLLAFYILIYVGVEVTTGGKVSEILACLSLIGSNVILGWIVTYIIQERHGGPSSGYISAGFFAGEYQRTQTRRAPPESSPLGLMTGRVALLWVNEKIGERRVIFFYALLAIGLEFVIWFVPSLIGDAVAVSIVGVLLGPMYPIAMNHAGRVLPRWILTGSIGWIAGFGQAGSAILPFMTGAISNKYGIKSLQPLWVFILSVLDYFFLTSYVRSSIF